MKELDLHGYNYHLVELEVENFLFLNSNQLPVRIITGKSEKMRSIVIQIIEKNKFNFNIPAHNAGEIIVL